MESSSKKHWKEKQLPIENVDHHTQERPFGIYYITVPKEATEALYMHYHTEHELFLILEGEMVFTVEQKQFVLQKGDAIFIPPMLLHGARKRAGESGRFMALVFSDEMIRSQLSGLNMDAKSPMASLDYVYPVYRDKEENAALFRALRFLPPKEEYDMDECELTVIGVLFLLWQQLYNLCFSRVIPEKNKKSARDMEKVLYYMQEHYAEEITLQELAYVSGFSTGYFGHYFQRVMGCSPFSYLTNVRIAHACRYLTDTDKKITDIAAMTGFPNISYFNRTFLKKNGITPSNFRKQQKKEKNK